MNEQDNSHRGKHKSKSRYIDMIKRINLQSIGYFIKEGSRVSQVDEKSFSDREQNAYKELEKELCSYIDENTVDKVLPIITNFASKSEEIQFSLGIKVGAKLALLLTTDFEHDF